MMGRMVAAGALALAWLFTSAATAQVIYPPVRYQYTTDRGTTFYYGGDNPNLITRAQRPGCLPWRQRTFGYIPVPRPRRNFISQHPFDAAPLVYCDCEPDAAGSATVSDAMNDAYARVPLYFRKADLVPSATVKVIIPAPPSDTSAPAPHGTIDIHPYVPAPPAVPFDGFNRQHSAPSPTTRPASDKSPEVNK